ncbi:hypothetical protein FB451DRAFT_1172222 [Mycena latifolia]|nr:hypothetical protein FB451DRAFT_1172222 [Mycena latifolia]
MAMPPTTHALPQTHRAHLIRSTRKLGALLGETPLLLDPTANAHARSSSIDSISTIESKRSGRRFHGSPAPPRSSLLAAAEGNLSVKGNSSATARVASPAPARPLLYLRLAPTPRPTILAVPSPLTLHPRLQPADTDLPAARRPPPQDGQARAHARAERAPRARLLSAPAREAPQVRPQPRRRARDALGSRQEGRVTWRVAATVQRRRRGK